MTDPTASTPQGRTTGSVRTITDTELLHTLFELGDPIDQQERIAVRQNPLDRGVVEREGQGIHLAAFIEGKSTSRGASV